MSDETTNEETRERGMEVRREVLGDDARRPRDRAHDAVHERTSRI